MGASMPRPTNHMVDMEIAKTDKPKKSQRSQVKCSYCKSTVYRGDNCKNCGAPS